MIFGEIYKKDGEWRFSAVGQGYAGGLAAACNRYGINIG
jgi:tellurium resistance protein TerD